MIIVKYTLTAKGKIPSYIVDGGYYPKKNNNPSPQDYDFIGVSSGNEGLGKFNSQIELKTYLDSISQIWTEPGPTIPFDQAKHAQEIWSKLQ